MEPSSVRPDFASPDGSVTWEVKNYNLAKNSSALVRNVAAQAIARELNLPAGAIQNVLIDKTGQTVSLEQEELINARIEYSSKRLIPAAQIEFFKR